MRVRLPPTQRKFRTTLLLYSLLLYSGKGVLAAVLQFDVLCGDITYPAQHFFLPLAEGPAGGSRPPRVPTQEKNTGGRIL